MLLTTHPLINTYQHFNHRDFSADVMTRRWDRPVFSEGVSGLPREKNSYWQKNFIGGRKFVCTTQSTYSNTGHCPFRHWQHADSQTEVASVQKFPARYHVRFAGRPGLNRRLLRSLSKTSTHKRNFDVIPWTAGTNAVHGLVTISIFATHLPIGVTAESSSPTIHDTIAKSISLNY